MFFKDLNKQQIKAVKASGHVLLTACPGSGKTRVITHKIAYELDRLESSKKKIAAITFTNRAADEIIKRVDSMGICQNQLWTGTIHSFCLEWILKPYSGYLDELKNGYRVAEEADNIELLAILKKKYGYKRYESINLRFNRDGTYECLDTKKRSLISDYYNEILKNRTIDFNQLLYFSHKLLIGYPIISKILSNIFSLICVDEYQDTHDLQYSIISKIIATGQGSVKVFFAGDPDQAVYHSLGGIAKPYSKIKQEINAELEELSLPGNYRTNQRIIDFYSEFQSTPYKINGIGGNRGNEGVVTFNTDIHKDDLIEELARLIKLNIEKKVPENEICILVPQWRLITSMTKKLRAMLPQVKFDASGITPMSKLRENIWYKISKLFLTEPKPNLFHARLRWAEEIILEIELLLGYDIMKEDDRAKVLLKTVNSINSDKKKALVYLKECFDQLMQKLGIVIENTEMQNRQKTFFDRTTERLTEDEYVFPDDTESFKAYYKEAEGIVINTCVGIKGEEFETVIAFGLLSGYLPHWDDIIDQSREHAMQVSRKLLYVICSRAKNNLHLIAEKGRKTGKNRDYQTNSELGQVKFNYDCFLI
ncbi:MAG: UvrD-helicase domain-containing protein [Sedimentisphaeraceae bacterium JB056]